MLECTRSLSFQLWDPDEAFQPTVGVKDILFLSCSTISQNMEMRDRREVLNHPVHSLPPRIAPCSTFSFAL